MLDICTLIGLILQHVVPSRIFLTYKDIVDTRRKISNLPITSDLADEYREAIAAMDGRILSRTASCIIDTLAILPSAPFILLCPSLWSCTCRGMASSFSPLPHSDDQWDEAFGNVRVIALSRIVFAFFDWACVPLAAVALLSPFRHRPFLQAMREDGLVTCRCLTAPPPGSDQSPQRHSDDLFYNSRLRVNCVYFGFTAIVDILLCPVLMPLLVTWYRYAPIREGLFPSSTTSSQRAVLWGFKEYAIISRQFCFLLCDLLLLPGTAVVFLTQARWRPLAMARARDDLVSVKSLHAHAMVLWCLLVLLVDVITLPFSAVVLLTVYRSEPLVQSWRSVRIWNGLPVPDEGASPPGCCGGDGGGLCNVNVFFFHFTAFTNFFLIVHDVVCVPVLVAFTLLSGIRSADAVLIIQGAWEEHSEHQCARRSSDEAAQVDIVTTQPTGSTISLSALSSAGDNGHNAATCAAVDSCAELEHSPDRGASESAIDSTPFPQPWPTSVWRERLWIVAMNVLLDLPFVGIALIVLVTVWRAWALYDALVKVAVASRYDHDICDRDECCCDEDDCCCCCCDCCCGCCCASRSRSWRRRLAVLEQFAMLLRDILFLVPLCVVLCSLYRLPGFVLDVISRCFPVSRLPPALVATEVRFEVPADSKDPITMHATCRRNPQASPGGAAAEVNSLRYRSPVKLFVAGPAFWEDVGRIVGDGLMRLGKSMIPLRLVEGQGVCAGVVTALEGDAVEPDQYEVWVRLDYKVKRTTILKKLQAMNAVSTNCCCFYVK